MKTRLLAPTAAWLLVCSLGALLLLSACGEPTPSAGRVAETVTPAARPDTPASPTTVAQSTEPPESTGSPTADVSPSPAATATETPPTPPPATATPTETPTPPATPTGISTEAPTATSTPEALAAPRIEGLKLVNGKYVAEMGNPYGLKVGEEVGYPTSVQVKGLGGTRVRNPDGIFEEEVGFEQKRGVVINNQKVLAYLMNEANTPGNVKAGKWRVPVPFVPGTGTRMWEAPTLVEGKFAIEIDGLSNDSILVNPFHKSALVKRYIYNQREQSIGIFFPKGMAPIENRNWMLSFIFSQAGRINVNNEGKYMSPGAILATGVKGNILKRNDILPQAALTIANLDGGDSLTLTNFLHINEALVFVSAN